jgi:putative ABC transport system permease protein
MNSRGLMKIGFKLLVNDGAKFSALLIGITFAVFLMVQMTAVFSGILNRAYANITNIGASMWILDPAVNVPTAGIPMPDYLLDAVRSMDGVRYAVPLLISAAQVKLASGTYQAVSVVGLDDDTLFGHPLLEQGQIEDIYSDNGFFVVDDPEIGKLGNPGIGSEFELNDLRGVIVGVAKVASNGLNGIPTLYTTYWRAVQYIPSTRFTMSYVLVQLKDDAVLPDIQRQVAALGYVALTQAQFKSRVASFFTYQTGIGTNILVMMLVSFLVGLSISGQTFYSFILENLEKFGALKAIGAKNRELVLMILFMGTFTALTGYGLGIGLVTLMIWAARTWLPNYAAVIGYGNLAVAFGMVVLIAAISSYVGIRKVLRIEPFDIFRS